MFHFVATGSGCALEDEKRFVDQTVRCGDSQTCESVETYCYVAEPQGFPDTPADYWCKEYPVDCQSCGCLVDPEESFYSCEEDDNGIKVTLHGF